MNNDIETKKQQDLSNQILNQIQGESGNVIVTQLQQFSKEAEQSALNIRGLLDEINNVKSTVKSDIDSLSIGNGPRHLGLKSTLVENYTSLAKTALDAEVRLFTMAEKRGNVIETKVKKIIEESTGDTASFNPSQHAKSITMGVNKLIEQLEDRELNK